MPDDNGHGPATLQNPLKIKVVRFGWSTPEDLLANPDNPKIHPDAQQQALAGMIDEIGFADALKVNLRTSEEWPINERNVETLIDGHSRDTILLRSNVKEQIPVMYLDLTPDEERKFLLTFDPIASMAAADRDKLDELLKQVQSDDARVMAVLEEIASREGMYLTDDVDFSEFSTADGSEFRYRVIVDGFVEKSTAQELAASLDNAKVEQYRL